MQRPVKHGVAPQKLSGAREGIGAAQFPLIRQFKVALTSAEQPSSTAGGSWVTCTPETAGLFTAVGYFLRRPCSRNWMYP